MYRVAMITEGVANAPEHSVADGVRQKLATFIDGAMRSFSVTIYEKEYLHILKI
jgi:hypothetical protein